MFFGKGKSLLSTNKGRKWQQIKEKAEFPEKCNEHLELGRFPEQETGNPYVQVESLLGCPMRSLKDKRMNYETCSGKRISTLLLFLNYRFFPRSSTRPCFKLNWLVIFLTYFYFLIYYINIKVIFVYIHSTVLLNSNIINFLFVKSVQ